MTKDKPTSETPEEKELRKVLAKAKRLKDRYERMPEAAKKRVNDALSNPKRP